jgi:hypothetical protein
MKSNPVELKLCLLIQDCLSGATSLTVGVLSSRGRLAETMYQVHQDGPGVTLVKEDGEAHTVTPGGRCTCEDAKFRRRICKHVHAVRAAGLLENRHGAAQATH